MNPENRSPTIDCKRNRRRRSPFPVLDRPVIQLAKRGWGTAEWGFAIGSPYWGTGVYFEGARLVVDFPFETLGVHRLEARAAVQNGRGNGALRKLGAMQEGVLRKFPPQRRVSRSGPLDHRGR